MEGLDSLQQLAFGAPLTIPQARSSAVECEEERCGRSCRHPGECVVSFSSASLTACFRVVFECSGGVSLKLLAFFNSYLEC